MTVNKSSRDESKSDALDETLQELPNLEVTGKGINFDPIYLIDTWKEPVTKTKRITVAANLPSGVNKSDPTLCVTEDGMTLEITVTWPDPKINLEVLHQKSLQLSQEDSTRTFTMYHPAVLSLEDALNRKRPRANANVISTGNIPLSFPVQMQIDQKSNLHFKASAAKIVYIELKGISESYATVNDGDEFEEF